MERRLRKRLVIWPSLIIVLIGAIWLLQETSIIETDIPIGPFCIICTGLGMLVIQRR